MSRVDPRKQRILELVRSRPAPRRGDRRLATAALGAIVAAAMAGTFLLWGGSANGGGARPTPVTAWILAGAVALAIGATWLALPPRRSMLPRPRGLLLAVALGVPLAVGAWLVLWHAGYQDPFVRAGWRCLGLTLATAPWPFALLAFVGPRVDPVQPALSGAALGAAAGAWAAVMVELWCPLADPDHVAKGHVLPLVALVALGALLGRRLFRMRAVGGRRRN
jgi:hypothetical protein